MSIIKKEMKKNIIAGNENKQYCYDRTRNIMCSYRKLMPFLQLIRGAHVDRAIAILANLVSRKFSFIIIKSIKAAIANGVNNHGLDKTQMYVKEAYSVRGKCGKRPLYCARGRMSYNKKYMCHLFIGIERRV